MSSRGGKLSYSELGAHLEKAIAPLYLLLGDQELLRELAAKAIEREVVGEAPSPFNYERFDGEEAGADDILMACDTMPLLGGRRLVYVKRASRLLESGERFERYVENPSPHTCLVLDLERKPDARFKSTKELLHKALPVHCDAPKAWELEDWVGDEARARGLKLGREDVRFLVAEMGTDLRRLVNELEKLSLYAAGERLDPETLASVLGRGKAQSIFRFVDAVALGDAANALRQLGRLIEEGEPPLRILALLDRLVGQLRVAKEAQSDASGKRDANLASVLGVPPSAARGLAQGARGIDEAFVRRAVQAVADTDRLLKSSRLPARVVLETLVVALVRRKRAVARP